MPFRFRLKSLQQYREHQRNLCRQLLAQVLAEDARVQQKQQEVEAIRESLLTEMAELQNQNRINVDQAASRRYHAAQLQNQCKMLAAEREVIGQRIQLCRQTLTRADQEVKVLERLSEKQYAEYLQHAVKREDLERAESWQAGQTVKNQSMS